MWSFLSFFSKRILKCFFQLWLLRLVLCMFSGWKAWYLNFPPKLISQSAHDCHIDVNILVSLCFFINWIVMDVNWYQFLDTIKMSVFYINTPSNEYHWISKQYSFMMSYSYHGISWFEMNTTFGVEAWGKYLSIIDCTSKQMISWLIGMQFDSHSTEGANTENPEIFQLYPCNISCAGFMLLRCYLIFVILQLNIDLFVNLRLIMKSVLIA